MWETQGEWLRSQIKFKLVSSQVRCPGGVLILLLVSQCQASEVHQKSKDLTSPGIQSVEIDVFSEDDPPMSIQNLRKVIFPGCSQKKHSSSTYLAQNSHYGKISRLVQSKLSKLVYQAKIQARASQPLQYDIWAQILCYGGLFCRVFSSTLPLPSRCPQNPPCHCKNKKCLQALPKCLLESKINATTVLGLLF